jgi:CHAD domain-containing protein
MAFQASRSVRLRDAESVHDLRVAIRRLNQALRLFSQFFPRTKVRKLQRRMREVMDLAAAVRDCDVALDLVRRVGGAAPPPLVPELHRKRGEAERDLLVALAEWRRRGFEEKWRRRLGL